MDLPPSVHMQKVPVVQTKDYTIKFERVPGMTLVHCTVKHWSPGVQRRLMEDWKTLCALHGQSIFALHTPDDHKHLKFLKMFGFEFVYHYDDDLNGATDLYKKE